MGGIRLHRDRAQRHGLRGPLFISWPLCLGMGNSNPGSTDEVVQFLNFGLGLFQPVMRLGIDVEVGAETVGTFGRVPGLA